MAGGDDETESRDVTETTAPEGPPDGGRRDRTTTTTTGAGFGLVVTVGTLLGIVVLATRRVG